MGALIGLPLFRFRSQRSNFIGILELKAFEHVVFNQNDMLANLKLQELEARVIEHFVLRKPCDAMLRHVVH